MKANLGALFVLGGGIQKVSTLWILLFHIHHLNEEHEASHTLKTTRLVIFFFFSWILPSINILNLRRSIYNTKGRVNLFLKLNSF